MQSGNLPVFVGRNAAAERLGCLSLASRTKIGGADALILKRPRVRINSTPLDNQMLHSVHGHFEILVLAVWAQDSVDQFLDSFHSLTYRRDTTHICDTLYECCYSPLDFLWCVSVRKALGQHCRVSTAYLSFAASSQARGNRLS